MELWFSEYHAPDVKHSIRVNRHLFSKKSDYQQIDIFDTAEFGKVLVLDGNVMLFSYLRLLILLRHKLHKGMQVLHGQHQVMVR